MSKTTGKNTKAVKQNVNLQPDFTNFNWEDKRNYTWDLNCIDPANPDWNNLVFAPITSKKIKDREAEPDSDAGINYTSFKVHQIVNGKLGSFLFKGNRKRGAIFESYSIGKPKTPQNFQGYQVLVDITDKETIENPNTEEQSMLTFVDDIRKRIADYGVEHLSEFDDDDGTFANKAKADPIKIVKELAPFPRIPDPNDKSKDSKKKKTIEDKDRPRRMTAKLLENREKGYFITKVYGPGDKEVDPRNYLGKPLYITPIYKLDNVFVGPKNLSPQLKIWEMNIEIAPSASRPRLIGKNEAPEEEEPVSPPKKQISSSQKSIPKNVETTDDPNRMLSPVKKPASGKKEETVKKVNVKVAPTNTKKPKVVVAEEPDEEEEVE